MFKYLEYPLSQPPYLELFQSRGGGGGGGAGNFLGGASLDTFLVEAQLNITLYVNHKIELLRIFKKRNFSHFS